MAADKTSGGAAALTYAGATFLGSFLLFLIQPLIGRYILPWFGSAPAVWATCLVVFQSLLLGGYAYAHGLARVRRPRAQALAHGVVVLLTLALLPIIPDVAWKPGVGDGPAGRIVLLLVFTIGGPFMILAAGGPLIQSWFSRTHPTRSPYRLYALSNLGSMGALLLYPVLVEPRLRLADQAVTWSALYGAYALLILGCGVVVWRGLAPRDDVASAETAETEVAPRPSAGRIGLWIGLSACGSALLLSTTNQMCQDLAVVPFLWILPLALFLLTFVICFDHERWYNRPVFSAVFPIALIVGCLVLLIGVELDIVWQIVGYSLTLFVGCMLCHGELVRLKPAPAWLTLFYLSMAFGGALGGLLIGIAAPLVLPDLWEYHLSLLACYAVVMVAFRRGASAVAASAPKNSSNPLVRSMGFWIAGLALIVGALGFHALGWTAWYDKEAEKFRFTTGRAMIAKKRGFYGVVRVYESGEAGNALHRRTLKHGRILHGTQLLDPSTRHRPTTYYGPNSGVGVALRFHPRRVGGGPIRYGVVGLGAGTLASYARGEDVVRFYEINPQVVDLAREHFTFLGDAEDRGADVDVYVGDARIVMERQLEAGEGQQFDVLAIDAFSSDAIPIHLLTRECFALYQAHLREGGIIALHISNRHINLRPVALGLAKDAGMVPMLYDGGSDESSGLNTSEWVVISTNPGFTESGEVVFLSAEAPLTSVEPVLWTDDFSSVYDLLLD